MLCIEDNNVQNEDLNLCKYNYEFVCYDSAVLHKFLFNARILCINFSNYPMVPNNIAC